MPALLDIDSLRLSITLACGRHITVDGFLCGRTYGGLLEGRPSKSYNDYLVKEAMLEPQKIWGNRATHLIPPVVDETTHPFPRLPRAHCAAWLNCDQPVKDKTMCGSHLIVVWFEDDITRRPLEQIIADAVRGVAWNDLAEDWCP